MGHPEAGTVLAGRYRMTAPLGSAETGSVWRARDTLLGRDVAVRILSPDGVPPTSEGDELRRNARALARLSHPRVADVYDYREDDGCAFLVMELLGGETLAAVLRREHRLHPARAVEIAAQVAQALDAAHRAGLVHGDLRPDRIILTRHGVKLVAFAVTPRSAGRRPPASHSAPELRAGQAPTPDGDLYALGALLREMLTGEPPRTGTHRAPPPGSSEYPDTVPRSVALLCDRLLAADPAERLRPAGAVADALHHAVPRPMAKTTLPAGATRRPRHDAAAPVRAAGVDAARAATTAPAPDRAPRDRSARDRSARDRSARDRSDRDRSAPHTAESPPARTKRRTTPRVSRPEPTAPSTHLLRDRRWAIGIVVVAVVGGTVAVVAATLGGGPPSPAPSPVPSPFLVASAPAASVSATTPFSSPVEDPATQIAALRTEISVGAQAGVIGASTADTLTAELGVVQTHLAAHRPDLALAEVRLIGEHVTAARGSGAIAPTEAAVLTDDLQRLTASLSQAG